jgi:hypothetical protein
MSGLVTEAKIQLLEVPIEPLVSGLQEAPIRTGSEAARSVRVEFLSYIGRVLLSAASTDDLDDRIDDLLDDPKYHEYMERLAADAPAHSVVRRLAEKPAPPKDRMPNVTRVVGEAIMKACDRLLAATLRANAAAIAGIDEMTVDSTDTDIGFGLPSDVVRAIYGYQVASAAIYGLRAADNANAADWIVWHLIEKKLMGGLKDYLRLLAGIPGVDVPFDLIPASERIEFASLVARSAAADTGYRSALSRARHGRKTVFPPVSADD